MRREQTEHDERDISPVVLDALDIRDRHHRLVSTREQDRVRFECREDVLGEPARDVIVALIDRVVADPHSEEREEYHSGNHRVLHQALPVARQTHSYLHYEDKPEREQRCGHDVREQEESLDDE